MHGSKQNNLTTDNDYKALLYIRLTSAELGFLWSQYLSDSMAVCFLKKFSYKVEDLEIKAIVDYALQLSTEHLQRIKQFFKGQGMPVPVGFNDGDVMLDAPRLYSDTFYLNYIKSTARVALGVYGVSLASAARSDIRDFFSQCLASTVLLDGKVTNLLLSKGLYHRPPYINIPEKIDFIKKQGYLGGLLVLGEKRPLNAMEITNLFSNAQTNAFQKALLIGFSQVAQSRQIRDYFIRGRDIYNKHFQVLSKILLEDDIPSTITWDSDIMDSKVSPFSDKIMLFHTVLLIGTEIVFYGASLGSSTRVDLTGTFTRLTAELMEYAGDGAKLLINNGWMEEPPQAYDREALAKKMH